ncbi:MAG: SDR family NAD(P)-dependent oxidoreductase [Hyphomicrobiales bacterium]|nr:SDR family NAD(P)-dependent oxidoreductase [Hyphomicrobiales bacterium]MCP5373853.1 SDR family NAD(P)-dependent oxidoreductase [Hyphomicrobiales bacterium]
MTRRFTDPRSILVTGASSGIGRALALAYAGPGRHLALCGRDDGRLAAVAGACAAAGAAVTARVVDVTDAAATADWIAAAEAARPLDLVIANAGVSAGSGGRGEDAAQTRRLFATNIDGVVNTVWPALPPMRARGHGQVVLVASLAGYRGLPTAPAYSASKAAVKAWGEGLRPWLAGEGIGVTVVCPGFVESGITATNRFPMPMMMTAERAAALIRRRLARNPARLSFPWPLVLGAWLNAALPPALVDPVLARAPKKE